MRRQRKEKSALRFAGRRNLFFIVSVVFKILIEIAGNHAVIELSHLVGLFAVEALKALVRGDHVDLPGGEGAEVAAHVAVEALNLLARAESLAVRRIGNDRSAAAFGFDAAAILTHDADGVIDTCGLCILDR